ncbi:sugar ABC transporter substrate-binding protein [Aquibacillus kalidii]|uniref:sugar ABC transporter substrate-binding protein n=1 Tax=Aquibacillus kalidii TaxID=2762597 RepID=UPI001648BF0A|nr:substrate-binding domain-containing protein [Aquibacillus kalidii]
MKQAYTLLTLILILIFVLTFSACKPIENDDSQEEALDRKPSLNDQVKREGLEADRKVRIGFSMDTLEEERWLKDRDLFKQAVEALGAEVEILASQGDDALQISQAETLINQGIDVLVIVPHNAESTAIIVKKAHAAGIKVLSYDRLVKNSEVDLYVSYDNEMVGELQAIASINMVSKGNYVLIGGAETDNNAHLVKKGIFNVLQPLIDNGNITIVYDQWTKDWLPENALANMQEALQANGNDIDAVIAGNDATAGVIIQELEKRELSGRIPIVGQDAELAAIQRIVAGTQSMTVYKPIKDLTQEAAELAIKLAKGMEIHTDTIINNGRSDVPSVLLEPIPVNSTNIEETIILDGFHSRESIYN